ncbi:trafficking protein particle complex protein 2 [Ramicandelaber brevisporus]|nr:trafficking protein particle complex protein 2 [Ramicandelaber brevisporus]
MSTFYFVIVGPGDRPLYEAELGLILNAKHLSQFIVHSALDVVDEAVWASSQPYLRAVDRFNDQLVSAYVTPGNIRLLLVHSAPSSEGSSSSAARTEESIRLFFTDVHDIYVKAQMNPFFSTGTSIKSPAFDAKVRALARRHLF